VRKRILQDVDIEAVFASLGQVTLRPMFGGSGVYYHGMIIGLYYRREILLKTDPVCTPRFEAAGATQGTYTHPVTGKIVHMPYWSLPEEAWDDADAMARWVRIGYEAALRSPAAEIGPPGVGVRKKLGPGPGRGPRR
jgi:DNA transformation protein